MVRLSAAWGGCDDGSNGGGGVGCGAVVGWLLGGLRIALAIILLTAPLYSGDGGHYNIPMERSSCFTRALIISGGSTTFAHSLETFLFRGPFH